MTPWLSKWSFIFSAWPPRPPGLEYSYLSGITSSHSPTQPLCSRIAGLHWIPQHRVLTHTPHLFPRCYFRLENSPHLTYWLNLLILQDAAQVLLDASSLLITKWSSNSFLQFKNVESEPPLTTWVIGGKLFNLSFLLSTLSFLLKVIIMPTWSWVLNEISVSPTLASNHWWPPSW